MEQWRNDRNKLKHQPPEMPPNRHHQPPPPQKCPRCDSSNTKFCYYNNYSLSQPRYFCKTCRRYWTHGGTLRNVPVGGGCRKSKRPKPSTPPPPSGDLGRSQPPSTALPPPSLTAALRPLPPIMPSSIGNTFYSGGSFLSPLAAMKGAALNLGGGAGHFEANMAVLHSFKPPVPQQFQLQNDQYYQNLRPSLTTWTESFINRNPATASAASTSFWSGGAADGNVNTQAGSSISRNNWQDSNPGLDPSS